MLLIVMGVCVLLANKTLELTPVPGENRIKSEVTMLSVGIALFVAGVAYEILT